MNIDLSEEQKIIREISDRIVIAQQPIRILDAVKWDQQTQQDFLAKKCCELPKVKASYYDQRPLPYDPASKKSEFDDIIRDINRKLGQFSGIAQMMIRLCREYQRAVCLLEARGTSEFPRIALELYGSAQDAFYAGAPALIDLADLLADTLKALDKQLSTSADEKSYSSEQAVELLSQRLGEYFGNGNGEKGVRVMLSDDILADAAAGADCLKIRRNALFSERDIRLLEVHEGWVHLGTTLNGLRQPVCTFLGKGAPSSTITQEGLAVLIEIISFSSYPSRVQRVCNRVTAINMAENGANFLEVFNYFREQGLTDEQSYTYTMRVFRGSLPEGGPFTKDLAYAKGFILIYNYIRIAMQQGLPEHIPALFAGKTKLEDLQVITDLIKAGVVVKPHYMPPQFRDLAALSAWMCFSLFMNKLNLERFALYFREIIHR